MAKRLASALLIGAGLLGVCVLMSLLMWTTPTNGAIVGSAHDFSAEGWAAGQICLPCHTPHRADTTVVDAPLWNHEVTAATFTPYSSPSLDATMGQPSGTSKLCLSCHDGTVAVDSFGGNTGTTFMTGDANVGADLTDDHPVSFTYDAALATTDGELVNPAADGDADGDTVGVAAPFLPLFAGQLQCASCHDVHNTASAGNPKLLLAPAAGSAICLKCHEK